MNKKLLFYSLTGIVMIVAGVTCLSLSRQAQEKHTTQAPPTTSSYSVQQKDIHYDAPVGELDMAYDFSNKTVLANTSDHIILATVKSANYTNFEYRSNKFTDLIMTIGELEIKHVFKGSYAKGDVISYERPGGYLPVAQYEKGEVSESLAKRKALRQKSNIPELSQQDKEKKLIRRYFTKDDIEIKPGKTYLFYAINNTNKLKTYRFTKDLQSVEIIGFEYGAREANASEFSEGIKFKNNQTKAFEEFSFK